MSETDLSIVIVSWNVRVLLSECIRSILRTAKDLSIEIIVVDNASTDNTVEELRRLFPEVRVIPNNRNVGFPAANNQGMRISSGRFILLLNPDTVVTEDSLSQMVRFAELHPEVGLVGPRLQGPDGGIQYVCARPFPTPVAWFWYYSFVGQILNRNRSFGGLMRSDWDHLDSRPVDAITGAAMLFPRSTLEQVGLLDESHPMYLEDLDYCFRVHSAGKVIYYLAEAAIVHYGAQSSAKVSARARLLSLEAHRIFFSRYGCRLDALCFRLAAIGAAAIRLPALGLFRLAARAGLFSSPRINRVSLRGEIVVPLWGLGLAKAPRIESIGVRNA